MFLYKFFNLFSILFISLASIYYPTFCLAESVIKSPNDHKEYKVVELSNQLKVLLISDPDTDKAAAAMNVAVGSNANPRNRLGLAHFLEHMLFLGTEKYPEANDYQNFINSQGGSHNAYTSLENTNYFFDINTESLEPALDRFAQFFISPTFDARYVDRERHAVDSEYRLKIKEDYLRYYAVTKHIANPASSYNQFFVGNLETLSDKAGSSVRDELIKFYTEQYSANLMSLVVLGKEPLEQLEAMVRSKFSAIENRHLTRFKENIPIFKPNQLPQLLEIEAVKDKRTLILTFPVPEIRSHWKTKPTFYISNLLGYEGKGSLLSFLKSKGWVTMLSSGYGYSLPSEASFTIRVSLTPQGEENFLQITQAIFQYIELIKRQGIQANLYNENKQLADLNFRFEEQTAPIHLVSSLALKMSIYPSSQVISADYLFTKFDKPLIKKFLGYLNPDNVLISLQSKKSITAESEPYYAVNYRINSLTKQQLSTLKVENIDQELKIREANPYIAENLQLLTTDTKNQKPKLLENIPGLKLWYLLDVEFKIPQANLYMTIDNQIANKSPKNQVLNSLLTQMLQEELNEKLYDAYQANIKTDIYPHLKGFSIKLSGYNDKLILLFQQVIAAIKQPNFDKKLFYIIKQHYIESLINESKSIPYEQTNKRIFELLLPVWDSESKLDIVDEITLEDLNQYANNILTNMDITLLAHGNISKKSALDASQIVENNLLKSAAHNTSSITQTIQIPINEDIQETINISHKDTAISLVLQAKNNTLSERAKILLLNEIISSDFYNKMRTEKQLGYIVFTSPMTMSKTSNIVFVIQSPTASSAILNKEINQFLDYWQENLNQIDDDTLLQFKRSIVSRITRKETKLDTRSNRFWQAISIKRTDFDTREKLVAFIEKLTINELKLALQELRKHKLSIASLTSDKTNTRQSAIAERFAKLRQQTIFVPDN